MTADDQHRQAVLTLSDGTTFAGMSFGDLADADGEVVFSTGMVGYPESLTDPSYRGQILVLTYPLIGNYGVPADVETDAFESDRIQVRGLIVQEYVPTFSHRNASRSLADWLHVHKVPAMTGVDTRALVTHLRERGAMLGRIHVSSGGDDRVVPSEMSDPNVRNLVAEVSCTVPQWHRTSHPAQGTTPAVLLIDCGTKRGIIRAFTTRGIDVYCVPWDHDVTNDPTPVMGVIISNGPGDPTKVGATIERLHALLDGHRPILGICLGAQLLALAAGARTYKLAYGHRSQNQPCVEVGTARCAITTQNHGYAIDAGSLPADWRVWFTNANDGTVEGIRHTTKPFRAVQFHPEARPGPEDTSWIFDEFCAEVCPVVKL